MARVLVTGAAGFVGRHLCRGLSGRGHEVVASVRHAGPPVPGAARTVAVGYVGESTSWSGALDGVEYVVHCAGLAHQDAGGREEEYFEVNARGVQALARQSVAAGVRKFILLSTLKVNGEETHDRPFTPLDVCRPEGTYALSKFRGEQYLREIAASAPMRYSVIRPPLVYGPGVRANFLRLLSWIERGYPLPFAAIRNRRSLIGIGNLCSLIQQVIDMGAARSDDVLLASDGEDLSTPELIRRVAVAMSCTPRLLPVPTALLRAAGFLSGKGEEVSRLCGSLSVDISATCRSLNWTPPVSVDAGLADTVAWYRAAAGARPV